MITVIIIQCNCIVFQCFHTLARSVYGWHAQRALLMIASINWKSEVSTRKMSQNEKKETRRKANSSKKVVRRSPSCRTGDDGLGKIFYWPFQGGTSFVDLLCFVLSCVCYVLCASVYMCFVVTCWERADLLGLVCGVFCEFVTFPLVSWVRCGTWLYRFLIFAPLLTFNKNAFQRLKITHYPSMICSKNSVWAINILSLS